MSFKTVVTPPQMKPTRPNQPGMEREASAPQPKPKPRKPGQWPLAVRVIVSLLVAWHLLCVFLAPLSIQPASPLVIQITQRPPVQWYLDALYLNHGYHFFAPEPSNGHLIRYQVYDDRGGVIAQGEFPSKKENWPRLLYHRYFMLADQCEVPSENDATANQWKREYLNAFAKQLLREHNGAQVRVQRIVHYPAFLEDALRGMPLNDPQTYKGEEPIVTQRRQDLDMPPPTQGGNYYNNTMRRDVASGWQGGAQ